MTGKRRPIKGAPQYAIAPTMRADEGLKAICEALLGAITHHEPGVFADKDDEFLHQFRVSTRRTRSALSALKTVFPPDVMDHFRGEFRWLQQTTNEARDLDVWLIELKRYRADVPTVAHAGLTKLAKFINKERIAAYDTIRTQIDTPRYAQLVEDWGEFVRSEVPKKPANSEAGRDIKTVAAKRIFKAWKRLVVDGRALDPDGPVEPLHALRIRGKKLRYLMGFFAGLFPAADIAPLQPPLKALQDVLGTLNDLYLQQLSLRSFAEKLHDAGKADIDTLLAIGRLSQALTHREAATRQHFVSAFAAVASLEATQAYRSLFRGRKIAASEVAASEVAASEVAASEVD